MEANATNSRPMAPASELALLKQRYPEKSGCIRRIHPVWSNFFRVNYHQNESENVIVESYFVKVVDDDVTELNRAQFAELDGFLFTCHFFTR